MRLLLDEHLSPSVAAELRRRGGDVIAIAERSDLRGRPDDEIFAAAAADHRAIVTSDVSDMLILVRRAVQMQQSHRGLILLPGGWSSDRATGHLVTVIAALLAANPGDDAFVDRVEWIRPSGDQSSRQR
jgi:predicted nuclease of predicted toxin-antitoxin system